MELIRHLELFNPHTFNTPIVVIGTGASGSWLVLQLAKLGITDITVYDFDVVEEHNIPNQIFDLEQIGEPKVHALKNYIECSTGTNIKTKNEKYERQRLNGIVFLMVDSMAERKRIWDKCIKMKTAIPLMIEPRMGMSLGRVYTIEPTNLSHIKEYEATLYDDSEGEVSACGASMSVITSAMMIASMCTRTLINFHNNIEIDNEIIIDMMYNNFMNKKY